MKCFMHFALIFLFPFPQQSTLFVVTYLSLVAIQQKPCLFCSLLILALMRASCFFYASELPGMGKRCYVEFKQPFLFESRPSRIIYLDSW